MEKPETQRFDSLDSLRAIACFLVIWQHVSESMLGLSSGGAWTSHAANYVDFGRIGVVAFFCISGFVIPNSLRGPRLTALRSFAINRFFRLYPIYWFALGLGVCILWLVTGRQLSAATLLSNIGMVATFVDEPHVMGLFWTLEVELVFYFACALLYLCFGRHRLLSAFTGFGICSYVWKNDLLADQPGNLPILGYLLAIMFTASALRSICQIEDEPIFGKSLRWQIVAKIALALMVYSVARPVITGIEKSFLYEDPLWHKYGWGHSLGMLLFAIFFLLRKTPAWLAKAGRSTYSAYLLHALVFTLLARLWKTQELPKTRLELYIILSTLITFAIAALSFRYIERPCIRLGKRLAAKGKSNQGKEA